MNIQHQRNIIFCKDIMRKLRYTIYYVFKKEENLFIEKCYTIRGEVLKRDFGREHYMLKYQLCLYVELHIKIYKNSFDSYKKLLKSLYNKELRSKKRQINKLIKATKRS